MFLKAVPRRNGSGYGGAVCALCLPFELLLMETRGGCVFFILILYYAPALAQLDARYALGALCVVCDER